MIKSLVENCVTLFFGLPIIKFPNFYSDSKAPLDIVCLPALKYRGKYPEGYIRTSHLGVQAEVNMHLRVRGCPDRRAVKQVISPFGFVTSVKLTQF
jgi:hypothetical protein